MEVQARFVILGIGWTEEVKVWRDIIKIIVNGIVLHMISLISSNGIGTVAMLLAILVVGIRCVSTGVYWRKREIALGLVIS